MLDDLITAQNITKNLNTKLNMRMRHAKTIPTQYHIKTIKEKRDNVGTHLQQIKTLSSEFL